MHFLQNLSIKHKLVLIITTTSSIVLFLSAAAFLTNETISTRRNIISHMQSLAEIVSTNGRIPLQFHDMRAAKEILDSLEAEPDVRVAMLFNQANYAVARYARSGENLAEDENTSQDQADRFIRAIAEGKKFAQFQMFQLDLVVPIFDRSEKVGAVYLQSDLRSYRQNLQQLLTWTGLILSFSILLAFLLAVRLKTWVSRPLLSLVGDMKQVSATGDFSLRSVKSASDELGTLVDGFNQMLSGLQTRDEQIQLHHRNLEKTIASRTLELREANGQLQSVVSELEDAKKAAEQASEAKSLFLANMSHEIRTPMVGVLGMTELLIKSPLNDRQKSMARTVYSSGEALLGILNDILDFSKIESGKLELEQMAFDLWETVEDALELMAEKAFSKDVELIGHIDPAMPRRWRGDPGRLRQILLNLVSNAIKFTEEGEVVVRLRRRDGALVMEVQDTGIGIDADAQERIFDSFSQADNTTSRHFGGTGLGLAIVKQLADLMGGGVQVRSAPEEGTTFICTLGLIPEDAQPPAPCFSDRSFAAVIADPNASSRQMLLEQMRHLGVEAEAVPDGRSALKSLTQMSLGGSQLLLLSSPLLPDMDARSLLKELQADPALTPTRVLLLCHSAAEPDALPEPVPPLLHKPVRSSRLAESLDPILRPPPPTVHQKSQVFDHPSRESECRPRILVAEDNPSTVRLMRFLLDACGYEVDAAGRGSEAVELCRENRYALILMDCRMPGMDGYEATRRLREEGVRLPIIALSANNSPEDREACIAAGMDDFLCKPFKASQIQSLLEQWIPIEKQALA